MVVFLRRRAEIIRGRTGQARERDNPVNRDERLRLRGLEGDRQSFWIIATASLPVSAAGSASQCSISYPRREKRLHHQVAPAFDCAGSSASAPGAHFYQRVGRAGPAAGVGEIRTAWLSADASQECGAKFTICLIVMCPKRSHKCINGWCLSQNAAQLNRSPK